MDVSRKKSISAIDRDIDFRLAGLSEMLKRYRPFIAMVKTLRESFFLAHRQKEVNSRQAKPSELSSSYGS